MIIIYVDIILLVILVCLTLFACGYCFYRVHRLQRNGQVQILLRPTKVVFSHKSEGDSSEQLRTVVAYQNPFTGDYCIHKSRPGAKGYVNAIEAPDSPDSGVSDEYEPLNLDPMPGNMPEGTRLPNGVIKMPQPENTIEVPNLNSENNEVLKGILVKHPQTLVKVSLSPKHDDYSVNKTWNWNYTEYQI